MDALNLEVSIKTYANTYTDKGLTISNPLPDIPNIDSIKKLKYYIYKDEDMDGTYAEKDLIYTAMKEITEQERNEQFISNDINISPEAFKENSIGNAYFFEYGVQYIIVVTAENQQGNIRGSGEASICINNNLPSDILITMRRDYNVETEEYRIRISFNLSDKNKCIPSSNKKIYYIYNDTYEELYPDDNDYTKNSFTLFKVIENNNKEQYEGEHKCEIIVNADINNDGIADTELKYIGTLSKTLNSGFGDIHVSFKEDSEPKKIILTMSSADYSTLERISKIDCLLYGYNNLEYIGTVINEEPSLATDNSNNWNYVLELGDEYSEISLNDDVKSVVLRFYDENGTQIGTDIRNDIKL